tara:strand:- start:356 stop:976 length:621 start_codon:yes stop_codon:yes gene_type:complete
MKSEFIKTLTEKLNSKLPGSIEHQSMLAKPLNNQYNFSKISNQYTSASVLILIFPQKNIWNFFLTKRTDKLKYHKGQISLPGGTKNRGETLEETALRETEEEIGVNKLDVSLIGKLTPYEIPVTPFKIFPFIGWTKTKPYTRPNTYEVQKIITVSINSLINKKNKKTKIISMKNIDVSVPYFELKSEHVWGATGCILNEFREILTA